MSGPYAESVLAQLMEAGKRQQQRRRRRVATSIAAAVAAITGSVVLLLPNPAAADVRITIEGGFVEVHLTDRDATRDGIVDAFEDEGLTVSVDTGPTGPSEVGAFVFVEMQNGDAAQVEAPAVDGSFSTFRVREGWVGDLRVTLGREAVSGEDYLRATDSFLEGEPLHCAGVHGQTLADGAAELGRFNVLVNLGPAGSSGGQVDLPAALQQHPDWVVTSSASFSATELVVTAEPVEPRDDRC